MGRPFSEASEASRPLLGGENGRAWGCVPSSLRLKTTLSSELSGAVGDLGTYIPIVLALSLVNGLDLGTTLIFTAAYNAVTGLLFGIPMPVQPMKAVAAVAISPSSRLTESQIMAAGLCTASALLILGGTGLMSCFYRVLPLPVVRGVQLSQGFSFALSAVSYIAQAQDLPTGAISGFRALLGLDGLLLPLSALVFILLSIGCRRIPSALLVFLLGLALCFARGGSSGLSLGPSPIRLVRITVEDWKVGFFQGAVPQIPLSVLNSVIAVCRLSGDLFPERGEVSAARVSVSVGLMNWVGCWFGAVPVCHGAGGLAGQYKFGGRSGLAVLFLAAGKMALGLLFGSSFVKLLGQFPAGLLGVLLLFSGLELAMAARDMGSKDDSFVMLLCAAISLKLTPAVGFASGLAVVLLLRLSPLDCRSLWTPRSAGAGATDHKPGITLFLCIRSSRSRSRSSGYR